MAIIHSARADYIKALNMYDKAVKSNPSSAAAYKYRGGVYVTMVSDEAFARKSLGEESRGIPEYQDKLKEYRLKVEYRTRLLESHAQDIAGKEQELTERSIQDLGQY